MMKYFSFLLILLQTIHANTTITLSDAFEESLKYEAILRASSLQSQAKEEAIDQARGRLYPQLSTSARYTSRDYKENRYLKRDLHDHYLALSVNLDQSIYEPQYYSELSSSKFRSSYAKLGYQKQKQELALQVVDAYIQVIMYKNNEFLAKQYVESNRIKFEEISKKHEMRLSNEMDYLEAKISLAKAELDQNKFKNDLEVAKLKLKRLTGIDIVTIDFIDINEINTSTLPNVNEINLVKNIDIKMAQNSLNISEQELQTSKYGHYPRISASASYTDYTLQTEDSDYENDFRVMVQLKLPIYEGGVTASRIEENRLLREASRQELLDQERDALLRLQEYRLQYTLALKNILLALETQDSAKLYFEASSKGYEHGLKSLYELQDSRTKYFKTKQEVLKSLYDMISAYVSLVNTSMGLDEEGVNNISNVVQKLGTLTAQIQK